MKVLVTGATGYAGFHAAIAFSQAGHQVHGLVRDKSKNRARELLKHEVNLVEGDLSQPKTYKKYLDAQTYYNSWKASQEIFEKL